MDYKLFVGIDISKLSIDVVVLTPQSVNEHFHHVFSNNQQGFSLMLGWLTDFGSTLDKILFCCEHTGLYALPLAGFLEINNGHLWIENGLHIKRSIGLQRGKSDKADALAIARYAFAHRHDACLYQMPAAIIRKLKHLLIYREQLVRHQTSLKCTCRELEVFDKVHAGYCISDSKEIIELYTQKIKNVDQQLLIAIQAEPELNKQFELMQTVHGIGKQTAFFILIYTQGFSSFSDCRKFACYCGVAPFPYSSGTSIRGRNRVSSLANRKLKALLTMCALNTLKKDNEFKRYYDRKKAEGKSSLCVLNVIKNKLISRVFATVKRGTPYTPEIAA